MIFSMAGTLAGALLIVGAALDAFLTIISFKGGGPLTNWWVKRVWACFMAIHRRRRIHRTLSYLGPALVIGTILVWYVLFLAGWSLVFASNPDSVVVSNNQSATTIIQRIYFTSSTISGVGYGDLVPTELPWTQLANVAAFTSTLIMSLALSYVIPVITAALEQRQVAKGIYRMGDTPPELLRISWTRDNAGLMTDYWRSRLSELSSHANKHLIYPILHYFHPTERVLSTPNAILNLSDAIFLASVLEGKDAPSPAFFKMAWGAIEEYIMLKKRHLVTVDSDEIEAALPRHLSSPDALRELDFTPVSESEFEKKRARYLSIRHDLVALCRSDGWWEPEAAGAS